LGLVLVAIVTIIQKIRISGHSVNWINFILLVLFLVANLDYFGGSNIQSFLDQQSNSSERCPDAMTYGSPLIRTEADLISNIAPELNVLVDSSVWKIESNSRPCYKGKFKGQYPDRFYCDDMIVSRWDFSNSGAIDYRWYTAVSAEWIPSSGKYMFNGFICENGKKVTVNKDVTQYYVHVSKDGTEIRIEY
jgi:hypothetical protein